METMSAVLFGPHKTAQRDGFHRIHPDTPGVLDVHASLGTFK